MRGPEASPIESEYGFSLPHLVGLGGLIAGIGLVLAVSSPPPGGPEESQSLAKSVESDFQKPAGRSARLESVNAARVMKTAWKPAPAERMPRPPAKPAPPAAVAAKPPADFWDSDVPAPLSEMEQVSYLEKSVPKVGLDLDQAEQAAKRLRPENPILRSGSRATGSFDRRIAKTSSEMSGGEKDNVQEILDAADVEGLPFAGEKDCELAPMKARALERYSRMLHTRISEIDRFASRNASDAVSFSEVRIAHRDSALAHAIGASEFQSDDAIPALVQILQAEPEMVREQLVERLTLSQSSEATRALADRAVFDLSPVVRHHASQALWGRPTEDFRPQLLKAFRYPWPRVAWHAAEAVVAANDKDAVPDLVQLLNAPDPAKPFRDESGELMVRELVRMNHFQNCLICHVPSRQESDLVQAAIPIPGEPIRPVYYGSRRLRFRSALVRADVTYLRQDFSVMHTVPDPKSWPDRQRFDYLVRTREATAEEIAAANSIVSQAARDYPQREAVLYALRKLTGRNAGDSAEAWRRMTTGD